MENKLIKSKSLKLPPKKKLVVAIIAVLVIVAVIVGVFMAMQPQRTVANFCSVAKEEKSNFQAGTDYNTLLNAFKKLDSVAPDAIHPDTSLVASGYQSIVSDPSKTTTTELGMANSQLKVSGYITKNCPDY